MINYSVQYLEIGESDHILGRMQGTNYGTTAEYIPHAGLYISLTYVNIIDTTYSILDSFQGYHHVDGLDSAVTPK